MHHRTDDTVELSTYTRALGGTDPHPTSIEGLVSLIDEQVDTVWSTAGERGTPEGAAEFVSSVRELVTLAQSLEGLAAAWSDLSASTAAAIAGDEPELDALTALYDDVVGDRDYEITTERSEQ